MPNVHFALPRLSDARHDPRRFDAGDSAWLKRMGLQTSDDEAAKCILQIGGPSFAALTWPNLPERAVQLAADFVTLMGLLEDTCGLVAKSPQRVRDFLAPYFALTWDPDDRSVARDTPLIRAFLDIWHRASHDMSEHWRRRTQEHWRQFFNGWLREADWHAAGRYPSLYTFWEPRRESVGARVLLDHLEATCGYEIAPRTIAHPAVRQLGDLSLDTVFLVNDVFSYEREKHLGEVHNFVMVLERERGWPLDRAIDECRRLVDDAYREFTRQQRALRQSDVLPAAAGEQEWRQLEHYVGMWHDLMRGNYDWHIFMYEDGGRYIRDDLANTSYLEHVPVGAGTAARP